MNDPRDLVESIIKNLDTGVLLRALSSVGINIPQSDLLADAAVEQEPLETLNELRIPLSNEKQTPPLFDSSKIFALARGSVARQMSPQARTQRMAMTPDAEPTQGLGTNYASNFG